MSAKRTVLKIAVLTQNYSVLTQTSVFVQKLLKNASEGIHS